MGGATFALGWGTGAPHSAARQPALQHHRTVVADLMATGLSDP